MLPLLLGIGGWATQGGATSPAWAPWASFAGAAALGLFTAWLGQESQRQLAEEREWLGSAWKQEKPF